MCWVYLLIDVLLLSDVYLSLGLKKKQQNLLLVSIKPVDHCLAPLALLAVFRLRCAALRNGSGGQSPSSWLTPRGLTHGPADLIKLFAEQVNNRR